jgi:endonuclease I
MGWVLLALVSLVSLSCEARPLRGPGDYYVGINANATGLELQTQLFNLINAHTAISYDDVWDAFLLMYENSTGSGCPVGAIEDPYSTKCWTPESSQCGNYKKEGDCYNREHSWPKSWWGGMDLGQGAQTDVFHLFATDGYDNGRRGDVPLGLVSSVTFVTDNGCKLGKCADAAGGTACWEPADVVKGKFARAYFYISTAYMGVFECCDEPGVRKSVIKPWMLNYLLTWHHTFPPSADEQRINDVVFNQIQGNRNPFIDYPQWATQIFAPSLY